MEQLVKLIPLFPLISFALIGLLNRRLTKTHAAIFACTGVLLSFIDSVLIFVSQSSHFHPVEVSIFDWISAGNFKASFSFLLDPLSSIFLLVITGVGFLIHVFSIGYMKDDDGFRRFFAYLNLFIFFMLVLVLGNNFLVMFIGWEGVGFCSFMLIGFWYKDQKNNDAAKKAFVMNRVGDLGFLIAMCLIFFTFGTLNYTQLFQTGFMSKFSFEATTITIITVCLFIGAMGKSAQIPLYTWLPDAMAGPTPVSALIHAATMVTAGIYMVARTNVLFSMSPETMQFVAIIGTATALLGASIGLFQNDIKKVLAYSTVSQLGLMFLALGLGAYTAAVFHVVTHAFFKALLFLGSGSVIHSMGGEQDIRKMGGLKKQMPITYTTFLIGTIAISGIPPLAGFFSKDQILSEALTHNPTLFVMGMLVSLMTAFYMFRLLFLTFHGKFRGTHEQEHHLHESPFTMTMPLVVLAVLAAFAGFIGFPHALGKTLGIHNWFDHYLEPVLGKTASHMTLSTELTMMGVTTALVVIVVLIARHFYVTKATLPMAENVERPAVQKVIYNKYFIDELYYKFITRPLDALSAFLQNFFDNKVVNGLVNGFGQVVVKGGAFVRQLQSGNINAYAITFVIAVILYFFNLYFLTFMLTLLLILIPLISSIMLFAFGRHHAKAIAFTASVAELAVAFATLNAVQTGQTTLLNMDMPWLAEIGIRFHINTDGISMLMVLLSTLLMPLIMYASFNRNYNNLHTLYGLMFLMQGSIIGSFVAMDGFLFYLFWEIALIPIYFIILMWGGNNRQKITFKFFIYTLFGSLFMLVALIYVYLQTPDRSFDIQALYAAGRQLPVTEQAWVMAAFFLAFAIKMPIFPFHTWQPDTYYVAPTPGVMMLSGIMSKMATYGLIRWVLPMVPQGIEDYGYILIVLSVISILYASFISIVQKDFKYLIAYSSIAHMGLISAGIIACNAQSLQGSLMEMLSHGINTVGLFFVLDIIFLRMGTSEMKQLGGIRGLDSGFAFLFFIIVLSVVALPFTNGFVGEFLLIIGLFKANAIAASFAGLSIILGVVYMFRSYQTMMLGETNSLTSKFTPLTSQEKITLVIIVTLIIGLGVYPKIILGITESSVQTLLQGIQ